MAGTARNEDAAVLKIPANKAIVQTVDILTPIVNDPFSFGRIAACNALSDVYAMGGTPWCAMNIACFPQEWAEGEQQEILIKLLQGGQSALDEAGAVLAGGHTIQDDEIKYGLAVTGIIDPSKIAANNHLTVGLILVLTKPLGIGILSTAVKAKWPGSEESEAEIIRFSGRLNNAAGLAIQEFHLPAATDITGFGLLGHALEMAQASNVCLALYANSLPILPHVLDFASDGLVPGGAYRNRSHCESHVLVEDGVDRDRLMAAYDPQTSGGLLLAVPKEKLQDLCSFLEEKGDLATVVGEVMPSRNDCIQIMFKSQLSTF